MIIKIFKLHPPCQASRFPFPAGIDSLAGIKKGKKKNGDIACEISSQLLEISIQRIRLIVVQKLPHSFVRSFHIFSRIFFFYFLPPFVSISMPRGQKKKKKEKLSGYCEKKLKTIENKSFRAIFAASSSDRAKSSRRKIIIIFLVER